jgi:outer membrane lipoprotein-sorting protein
MWGLMHVFTRFLVCVVILVAAGDCGANSSLPGGDESVARARRAWRGDWHAVWQVEWDGAPVRGPLVAEVWHTGDGRIRIETLEAPSPALSGLILVDDGRTSWLYDVRHDDLEAESDNPVRIPLASDALDAIDWLFFSMEDGAVAVSSRDSLESGTAIRLNIVLPTGERAVLWVHDETGLPSRVELHSATWGEASFVTRSISIPEQPHPGLFVPPQQD